MPHLAAPVAAAGITAAGATIGGLLNNSASKRATNAQTHANDAALQFERERQAKADTYHDQALSDYQKRYASWEAGRNAILQHYGIGGKAGGGGGDLGQLVGNGAAGGGLMGGGGGGGGAAMSLGSMDGMTPGVAGDETPQLDANGQPLAWNDWRGYGLRPV